MDAKLLQRSVNEGFSGGEKKRNEILQMALLEPTLAVLDETDSGLDIDALRIVSEGINRLRSTNRSMLVITHYQRLLEHIVPDVVHVQRWQGTGAEAGRSGLCLVARRTRIAPGIINPHIAYRRTVDDILPEKQRDRSAYTHTAVDTI
jgi:Fe-S cluster assembly ATP-binding protein